MNPYNNLDLFNIRKGNVCSLCEKQISWLADAEGKPNQAIALHEERAICRECYTKLKERYK